MSQPSEQMAIIPFNDNGESLSSVDALTAKIRELSAQPRPSTISLAEHDVLFPILQFNIRGIFGRFGRYEASEMAKNINFPGFTAGFLPHMRRVSPAERKARHNATALIEIGAQATEQALLRVQNGERGVLTLENLTLPSNLVIVAAAVDTDDKLLLENNIVRDTPHVIVLLGERKKLPDGTYSPDAIERGILLSMNPGLQFDRLDITEHETRRVVAEFSGSSRTYVFNTKQAEGFPINDVTILEALASHGNLYGFARNKSYEGLIDQEHICMRGGLMPSRTTTLSHYSSYFLMQDILQGIA